MEMRENKGRQIGKICSLPVEIWRYTCRRWRKKNGGLLLNRSRCGGSSGVWCCRSRRAADPWWRMALLFLGGGALSLVSQLGADTSLGRRFSYCLVPYSVKASSALNFGARATVTEPGAATTPLIPSRVRTYYTIELASVKVGSATYRAPRQTPAIVDSGTTLTYLANELVDPLVEELTRRVKLPPAKSPEDLLPLCFDVSGVGEGQVAAMIPDVTLELGGGAAVTLKSENTFVVLHEGPLCLAVVALQFPPVSIIGNIAQQNMHVGYDLDKGTVTFAPADCARSYPAPSPSGSV